TPNDGRAHRVASGTDVVGDADVEPRDQLDLRGITSGPPSPISDGRSKELEQRLGNAPLHDRSVRHATGDAAAGFALGGDIDRDLRTRRCEVELAAVEADLLSLHRHVLPAEELTDQLHRLADGDGRALGIDPQLLEAGHTSSDAE